MRLLAAILLVFCCIPQGYACPFERLLEGPPLLDQTADHWDNWVHWDGARGRFVLYAQGFPRKSGATDFQKKIGVKIRVYESKDGSHWERKPDVPSLPESRNWSGNRYQDWLYFTDVDANFQQRIVRMKVGKSGEQKIEVVSEPAEGQGYHTGEGDGNLSAWRDPFPTQFGAGPVHVYFASKAGDRTVRPGVGLLVEKDGHIVRSAVTPIEGNFTQLELPNVTRVGRRYLLLFSTTNRKNEAQPDSEVSTHFRAQWGDSPTGPWTPFDGGEGIVATPPGTYGFNLVRNLPPGSPELVTGFHRAPGTNDLSVTRAFRLRTEGNRVFLE